MPLSPMMQHYLNTKKNYPGTILFYRLGDFYEMFFDDARLVSKELELTLTGKDCGLEERAPMCGVPHHAADSYIKRLIDKGYKVAVCEQVEDPKTAKGIVKREVVRIVTPGTILDSEGLEESKNNYLCCVMQAGDKFGFAAADISTGQCMVTDINNKNKAADEIYKYNPAEIICSSLCAMSILSDDDVRFKLSSSISELPDWYFEEDNCFAIIKKHFSSLNPDSLGLYDFPLGTLALGAMIRYLYDTQKSHLAQVNKITPYVCDSYMLLDFFTRRNLELTETIREKQKKGSLLWVLDKTKTAMGARMLRRFIEQPLLDIKEIDKRLDCVQRFSDFPIDRDEIREYLSSVYDLERLMSRLANNSANPRDMTAFKNSLEVLPHIKNLLCVFDCELINNMLKEFDPCEDLFELIDRSIIEDPSFLVHEGNIIKDGYNEKVDMYRKAGIEGRQWLLELERAEREKTGIKNLKIKYNRVFGYYLEVTNSFKNLVPERYIRKQTLTNSERYTTEELNSLEETITGAQDKLVSLEYEIFCEIREAVCAQIERVQKTALNVALLDVFSSLSYVARQNGYVRPVLNDEGYIRIREGRHPVVELLSENGMFIPNDVCLDMNENQVLVITGPNMAGKSTYMRQNALMVLMAQIGSFVPASSAEIGICDRIFTRVGASDDLAGGQSTFMVEMTEVANILRNATKKSLLILDEIGRGTSTFDGLSIAWAVTEHIADKRKLGAKTLFATHYHELTELEGILSGVKNFCFAVKEKGEDIVFLRKIVRGGADKSYGIQVARLAGVPSGVLTRAGELVEQLAKADIASGVKNIAFDISDDNILKKEKYRQLTFFDDEKKSSIESEISDLDLEILTPIEALNLLYDFKKRLKKSDLNQRKYNEQN